jgi:hypothetical protein
LFPCQTFEKYLLRINSRASKLLLPGWLPVYENILAGNPDSQVEQLHLFIGAMLEAFGAYRGMILFAADHDR